MGKVAKCSIYDTRPQVCRIFPKTTFEILPGCTYYSDNTKGLPLIAGACACNKGLCCATPRQDASPTGAYQLAKNGGKPCKYLVWVDE